VTRNPLISRGVIPVDPPGEQLGIIVIDHGSRRSESNSQLLDFVQLLKRQGQYKIVEPAHMEIAQPDMATAMDNCVRQGALYIVIHPWFLGPGRHWREHIPRLAADAASSHSQVAYVVTEPLGLHPGLVQATFDRILEALDENRAAAGSERAVVGN
jgi:sirohydrochlorin ferrochelatase